MPASVLSDNGTECRKGGIVNEARYGDDDQRIGAPEAKVETKALVWLAARVVLHREHHSSAASRMRMIVTATLPAPSAGAPMLTQSGARCNLGRLAHQCSSPRVPPPRVVRSLA